MVRFGCVLALASLCATAQAQTPVSRDTTPHKIKFVTVEKGVKLEVLDWGGKGPPLLFLAGLTDTAHVFDSFAPKFTDTHHVYGMTRRGFGKSAHPAPVLENYDADRMGDDVQAVIAALKLNRPVLAGHSIAGEELSSVGSRHPESVAGLIYLDAAYPYAFYNPAVGDLTIDTNTVRRKLASGFWSPTVSGYRSLLQAMIDTDLSRIENDARGALAAVDGVPDSPPVPEENPELAGAKAIVLGERKYADLRVPILSIVALPHACKKDCETAGLKRAEDANAAQADFVERSNAGAKVVRLPNASHYVFRSNAEDVAREMNIFMNTLPGR